MTKSTKIEKPVKNVAIAIGLDEIPLPSLYGAAELKFFIRRNTYRGALVTLLLLLILVVLNIVMTNVQVASKAVLVAPVTKMSLEDLPPAETETSDIAPPPDVVINTGPAARAGNPVPVPDAMIAPDVQEFATMDIVDRASSEGGSGEDLGGFAGNIDWDKSGGEVKTTALKEVEPSPDDFVPVEKEPRFDMARLQGLVKYPDMARKAGIEGTVRINALVDKSGKITRVLIVDSDNRALDEAAKQAVLGYGNAVPAIMNNEPVSCWITVPITFRLK